MRSCAVLYQLNIDYHHTMIISPNFDYRQRNLGGAKEKNLHNLPYLRVFILFANLGGQNLIFMLWYSVVVKSFTISQGGE